MVPNPSVKDRKNDLKEKYGQLAPTYHDARYGDEKGSFELEQTNRMLLQFLQRLGYAHLSDLKILDVATGSGRTLSALNGLCKKIVGLDYVFEMLEQIKETFKSSTAPTLVQGDAEHLPFQRHQFDAIFSCRFFHLIPLELKRACLKEFSRIVKPEGIIIVEFINACYFLNPRTFLRTLIKSVIKKGYLSQKTIPFGWRFQFSFLEAKAVSGTWLPGFRTLMKRFPRTRPFLEWLMHVPPFNILSERILVAFTVKQYDKAWTQKENLSLRMASSKAWSDRPVVVKRLRKLSLKSMIQFLKDKNILKNLQRLQPHHFRTLKLLSESVFQYVTDYEKLQPIGSLEDIARLNPELQKSVLDALYEFQQTVHRFPPTWIERLDALLYRLDFFKRLLILKIEGVVTPGTISRVLKLYLQSRGIGAWEFKFAAHGDILSGGNLSLRGPENPEVLFLDFESVRKNEFFLYDLVHIVCKNPVQKVFEQAWIQKWFNAYLGYFQINWTENNRKKIVRLLQFCFVQALLRRLHERIKVDPAGKSDVAMTLQNLAFCFNEASLDSWLSAVLKAN